MSDLAAKTRAALDAAVAAIGGAPRKGQIEMAEAVTSALTDRHHLMVQAGTGTGKSLAYLIPALVHGRKVLVATATLALQRQLVERDLPAVVPALEKELGREITYAIYKGVGNYICLQKMNSEEVDPDNELVLETSYLEKDAQRLIAWAKSKGATGDRDDAPDVDRRVWLANSTSGRECVGADNCAYGSQCFAVNAKAKAQLADVVHMPGKLSDAFTKAADDFHDAMADYGDTVKSDFAALGRLEEIPSILEAPVRKVREAGAAITDALRADEEIIDPDAIAERARVKGAVTEITTTVGKLLKMGSSHVLWYEPTFSSLYLAPLSVSEVLRENLLTKTPVIATSATLTVGSGFDAMARSLGFLAPGVTTEDESDEEDAEIDPSNFQTLDVGSPFDFAAQGVLYLPKHLPEPGRDGPSKEVLTELGELIDAAGGRTLALFSSWRGVEAADAHLRDVLKELPITIITQKRGDAVGPLVERFAKDETSILLGTMSLWQGVDVPGNSCILVAIDRIPFPRPDEPVMAARSSQADAAGGSGFMQVSMPRAALLLAQGTGRLIRSEDDRGVVAILDSRIVTKRYGSVLLNSMPPLWRTSDKSVVRDSLKRLSQEFTKD